MRKDEKKDNLKNGEILIVSNNSPHYLADDPDFMEALLEFQYGEGKASERGFERMKKKLNE